MKRSKNIYSGIGFQLPERCKYSRFDNNIKKFLANVKYMEEKKKNKTKGKEITEQTELRNEEWQKSLKKLKK